MTFELRRVRDGTTAVTRLSVDRLLIGRGTNADLAFDDAAVDLEHALLTRDGEAWRLSDLDSVTGTWVDGRRIDTVRLEEGSRIEIGEHRIRVISLGAVPALEIRTSGDMETARPQPPGTAPAGPPGVEEAPPVDYAAAYRLRQGWLSKASLSLAAVGLALVAVLAVKATGNTTVFRPGPVSEAHAREPGARACLECHRPWRGAADDLCAECHEGHSVHQVTQASNPSCAGCHTEHRRLQRLQLVRESACVSCHRDLEVEEGAERTFAARVTDFGDDHPELALTVSTATGETRVPLSDPAARCSDPAMLKLNHRKHLEPGLAGPEGRTKLDCETCHRPGGPDGHLRPAAFERPEEESRDSPESPVGTYCEDCHQLGFDLARPSERAPHGDPERVHADLLAAFSRDPELEDLSPQDRHRRIIENPGLARGLDLSPAILEQVTRAELFLYETRCSVCHEVDLSTSPPTVAPPQVTRDWLPHARFPHSRHGDSVGLTCLDCHGGAETSTATADVLLPTIEVCRGCHGRGRATAAGGDGLRVPSGCADCHDYHRHPGVQVAQRGSAGSQGGSSRRAGSSRWASR